MKPRIVTVEDEDGVRSSLMEALESSGYAAVGFASADAFLEAAPPCDLLILDIMLPGIDGVQLCSLWRSQGRAEPVIFLSGRSSDFDKVHALESGGDDYLTKPFSMVELLCRVRVCLRRRQAQPAMTPPAHGMFFDDDGWRCWINGAPVQLTVSEYRILSVASRGRRRVFSREELMALAYPDDPYVTERNADAHVKRIRRKLRAAGASEDVIQTVYGLGYRFQLP